MAGTVCDNFIPQQCVSHYPHSETESLTPPTRQRVQTIDQAFAIFDAPIRHGDPIRTDKFERKHKRSQSNHRQAGKLVLVPAKWQLHEQMHKTIQHMCRKTCEHMQAQRHLLMSHASSVHAVTIAVSDNPGRKMRGAFKTIYIFIPFIVSFTFGSNAWQYHTLYGGSLPVRKEMLKCTLKSAACMVTILMQFCVLPHRHGRCDILPFVVSPQHPNIQSKPNKVSRVQIIKDMKQGALSCRICRGKMRYSVLGCALPTTELLLS